jgi:hypothetical protein
MTLEEFVYTTLSASSPVTAIVGQRIYPTQAPVDPTYPFLNYFRSAGGTQAKTLDGKTGLQNLELTIHCAIKGSTPCFDLRNKVRAALENSEGGEVLYIELTDDQQDEAIDHAGYYVAIQRYRVIMRNLT